MRGLAQILVMIKGLVEGFVVMGMPKNGGLGSTHAILLVARR
jgi:hypothetical protein